MKKSFVNPYYFGLFAVAVIAPALLWIFYGKQGELLLTAGELSPSHSFLNNDCKSCHQNPFEKIDDEACRKCHAVADHPAKHKLAEPDLNKQPDFSKQCIDCHGEHNGKQRLVPENSRLCQSCHAEIRSVSPQAKIKDLGSIEDHPEINSQQNNNAVPLTDFGTVKLNHFIHLKKDLQGKDGKTTLTCNSCHHGGGTALNIGEDAGKEEKNFLPISFDRDCRSCHPLAFDDRFKGSEVPHGNTDSVLRYLISEYSKLYLNQDSEDKTNPQNVRSLPGEVKQTTLSSQQVNIQNEARRSEEQLFTKTSCQLCHTIEEHKPSSFTESRYVIKKAEIKNIWLTNANFNHAKHLHIKDATCNSCHKNIMNSKETKDINLPEFKQCLTCHVQQQNSLAQKFKHFNFQGNRSDSAVPSDCVMCHSYH